MQEVGAVLLERHSLASTREQNDANDNCFEGCPISYKAPTQLSPVKNRVSDLPSTKEEGRCTVFTGEDTRIPEVDLTTKCDEDRPRCKGCRRNDLECSWPAFQRQAATDGEPVQSGESEAAGQCNSDQHNSSSSLVNGENSSHSPGCCGVSPLSSLGSFMTLIRPTLLTPRSGVFLQHYQLKTARLIVPAPDRRNPFLLSVLPLAQVDDLLMHCVMALGGAHLGSKVINMSAEIQTATMHHYFHVLRSLRKNIDNASSWSTTETLRTLLALIMISLFEVGSCNDVPLTHSALAC